LTNETTIIDQQSTMTSGDLSVFPIRRSLSAGIVATALLIAVPYSALAHSSLTVSASAPSRAHSLPKASGSTTVKVFTFGIKGGSMRPWTVTLNLDGSVSASGTTAGHDKLIDSQNTLKALLTLADAEGFFSMHKAVGCLGGGINPDVSSRFITIHTSSGTKRVNGYGLCAATSKYDGLYALLQAAAGVGA
jgi:hypothetical protein